MKTSYSFVRVTGSTTFLIKFQKKENIFGGFTQIIFPKRSGKWFCKVSTTLIAIPGLLSWMCEYVAKSVIQIHCYTPTGISLTMWLNVLTIWRNGCLRSGPQRMDIYITGRYCLSHPINCDMWRLGFTLHCSHYQLSTLFYKRHLVDYANMRNAFCTSNERDVKYRKQVQQSCIYASYQLDCCTSSWNYVNEAFCVDVS